MARRLGGRKPSLSDYDTSNFDDYESMQSSTWNKARGVIRRVLHTEQDIPVIGPPLDAKICWCGNKADHDWPGKEDGAPHPR